MQHLEQKNKALRISNIIIVDMLTLPGIQEGMGEYDKAKVTEAYHSLRGKLKAGCYFVCWVSINF